MKKILIFALVAFIIFALIVPAFAADSPSVRHGLYEDHFIYEGVTYQFEPPADGYIPTFIYIYGDELSVFFRVNNAMPYVTVTGAGVLTYFDGDNSYRMRYAVTDSGLTYLRTSKTNRLDFDVVDIDSFRSCFLVSIHNIMFYEGYNGGGIFRAAEPELFYDVIVDPDPDPGPDPDLPAYDGDILGFFSGLFDGLALIFQTTPMLYLFGILILAFIILGIKMIYRH